MLAMFHVGDQGRLEAFPGELARQPSKFPVLRRRLDPGLEDCRQASTDEKGHQLAHCAVETCGAASDRIPGVELSRIAKFPSHLSV